MMTARRGMVAASNIIYTGHCIITAMLLGMDGANDQIITVYDGIDNTGDEVIPTNQYDASVLGINGVSLPFPVECWTGIYVEIAGGGVVEVVVHYKERGNWGIG